MKTSALVSPFVVIGALSVCQGACAKQISISGNSPAQVKSGCSGTYFPPNKTGVYGCMNGDSSGIVCGGKGNDPKTGASFSKTCDTFLTVPPRLPGRNELFEARPGIKPTE
jgi:hypothetical protein